MNQNIEDIKQQIIDKFNPKEIYLFGSYAKGVVTQHSDIDICVIIDTDNKRQLTQKIYLEVESDMDFDIVIYTPLEWEKYKEDKATFANIINSTGVSLHG